MTIMTGAAATLCVNLCIVGASGYSIFSNLNMLALRLPLAICIRLPACNVLLVI